MPRSRARRPSERSTAAHRPRPSFRPGPETLEDRIVPAHNITIAVGGLVAIPGGATNRSDTGDYTLSPDVFPLVTGGTISLVANNDIRVDAPILLRDGVSLELLARRNVVVTGDGAGDTIRTNNGSIVIVANDLDSKGGPFNNRDRGDASLTLNDAIVTTSGTGTISLKGEEGGPGHETCPVVLVGRTEVRNNVTISGQGNTATRPGIFIAGTASVVDNAGGGITLVGESAPSDIGFSTGMTVFGKVLSNGGTIKIDATSRGTGSSNHGLLLTGTSARIENTGSGQILITGVGGPGPGSFGVSLDGGGGSTPVPMVVSQDGAITLDGTGTALATNFGVAIGERAQVRTNGSGALFVLAETLSLNPFATPGSISLASGNLSLAVNVLRLDDPGTITSGNDVDSAVTIQPKTATRPLVLGGPLSSDALVVNNTTFAAFSGFKGVGVQSGLNGSISMNGDVGPIGADLFVLSTASTGFVLSKTLDMGDGNLAIATFGSIAQAPGGLIKGSGVLNVIANGIGTLTAPLLTQVGLLAGSGGKGGLFINNTGTLSLGDGRVGKLETAGGDLVLNNAGRISISTTHVQTAGGAIRLKANGISDDSGFAIQIAGTVIDAQGGDIQLVANSNLLPAVNLQAGATVQTSGAGRITIAGKSTLSTGVRISDRSTIRSVDGPISITGETTTTTAGSPSLSGIELRRTTIESTGRGGISLKGLGSAQTGRSSGIFLDGSTLRVKDGPLGLLGTSRRLDPAVEIRSSTIQATGAGPLSFEGVAPGNANAIAIDQNAPPQPTSIAAGTGAIVFTGDSMAFAATARVQGKGLVLFQPRTPSRQIVLGSIGSTGTLGFSLDMLGTLAPGFSQIFIGRSDGTGRIATGLPLTFTSDVVLRSPGAGSAGISLSNSIDAGAHNLTIFSAGPVALNAGTLSVAGKTLRIKGSTINAFTATLSAGAGGRIAFEGDTTLRPATTIAVVLTPAQATNPALIDVTGKINLNNATLRGSGPGGIQAATGFSLIRNDGNDAISGRFAQGSSLTIAGQPYQLALNRGNNDALLKRQAPPINVKLVTKPVQNGRKKVKTTFIDANFVDGGQLKSETLSPLQPSRFKNIRITTADSDRDGTIDTVTVLGNVGNQVTTMTVSV